MALGTVDGMNTGADVNDMVEDSVAPQTRQSQPRHPLVLAVAGES